MSFQAPPARCVPLKTLTVYIELLEWTPQEQAAYQTHPWCIYGRLKPRRRPRPCCYAIYAHATLTGKLPVVYPGAVEEGGAPQPSEAPYPLEAARGAL